MMFDANVDYVYEEYKNQENNNSFVNIETSDMIYNFYVSDNTNSIIDNQGFFNYQNDPFYTRYFEQRPDVKMLYEKIDSRLKESTDEYKSIVPLYERLEYYVECSSGDKIVEKYDEVKTRKEELELEINNLTEKKEKIVLDITDYNHCLYSLKQIIGNLESFQKNKNSIDLDLSYDEIIKNTTSDNDRAYYSQLSIEKQKYELLILEKLAYEEKINFYITSAITLEDVSDELKLYNSSLGKVPAGQWDTWENPLYQGYGYESGLAGSFEGPQGKETGYDSRKGDEKTNYKDPDRSLLAFLSNIKDEDGNTLYPIESFEKGGEYYYHIFGVNDDGSINMNLIDNPRFGCKMLGNYLLVGADQRLNRERGSKVMTSLGPAIVFDYGTINDLNEDPSHIDISMDEVLFWLKDFSHNKDRKIESLQGIYDWCTTNNYSGKIDVNYEYMERNYVNNLNVKYDTEFTCIFDREDFEDETSYNDQKHFVYTQNIN